MALTAISVALTDGAPHVAGTVAINTSAGNGVALTVTGSRTRPLVVQLTGDVDWGFHQNDSVAYPNMQHVPAGTAYTIRIPNITFNLYMLASTGTGNVVVTAVEND